VARAIADTHAVLWYLYDDSRLSLTARTAFEDAAIAGETIGVSSISLVEIVYLIEKGRIKPDALDRVLDALNNPDSALVELPLDNRVVQALQKVPWAQIPEMPDRIIAATALSEGVAIISRDGKIRISDLNTIW